VNSPSNTSVPDNRKLALNPADTPAKAAANPASGCLPIAANNRAPSGGNTTYPASEATLDIIPANTSTTVINLVVIDRTNPSSNALTNPERSPTPIHNIVTRTTPSGANSTKFSVIVPNMYFSPSAFSRLRIVTISPASPGCSTSMPR